MKTTYAQNTEIVQMKDSHRSVHTIHDVRTSIKGSCVVGRGSAGVGSKVG